MASGALLSKLQRVGARVLTAVQTFDTKAQKIVGSSFLAGVISGAVLFVLSPILQHVVDEYLYPTAPAVDVTIPGMTHRGSTLELSVFRENTLSFEGLKCSARILLEGKELPNVVIDATNCGAISIQLPSTDLPRSGSDYVTELTAELSIDWGGDLPLIWRQPVLVMGQFDVRIESSSRILSMTSQPSISAAYEGQIDSPKCVWTSDDGDGVLMKLREKGACSGELYLSADSDAYRDAMADGQYQTQVSLEIYDSSGANVGSATAEILVTP